MTSIFQVADDGESVTATLANGEKVTIYVGDDGLGLTGYSLRVHTPQTMLILPSSSNAASITTPKAMVAAEALRQEVVRLRDSKCKMTGGTCGCMLGCQRQGRSK